MLPIRFRVELGVMAMKGYSYCQKFQDWNFTSRIYCVISRTLEEVWWACWIIVKQFGMDISLNIPPYTKGYLLWMNPTPQLLSRFLSYTDPLIIVFNVMINDLLLRTSNKPVENSAIWQCCVTNDSKQALSSRLGQWNTSTASLHWGKTHPQRMLWYDTSNMTMRFQ